MVLICGVDMVLQVLLLEIKLHLPAKQLVLILSVLLLPVINRIDPQVEVREVIIHVPVSYTHLTLPTKRIV